MFENLNVCNFNFIDLLEIIDEYLLEVVDPSNALELKEISKLFSLVPLQQKAENCIRKSFGEVCLSRKFLDLFDLEIRAYFKSDDIHVSYVMYCSLLK